MAQSGDNRIGRMTRNFFEGLFNIFVFLPYFFSVTTLFQTLFNPWKNLLGKKEGVGFSFEEWFNRLTFNLISRFMGFFMRISILIFFLIVEVLYILILPFLILLFVLLLPFFYIAATVTKSEEERKAQFKDSFIQTHSLSESSHAAVDQWFEGYYAEGSREKQWWKLHNLFSIPPLARDWAYGYTPTLDEYTEDLTDPQHQIKIQNAVDRQAEIEKIEEVLIKSIEGNILLVGEEGIGKHTIVDALAKKIYEGTSNNLLAYKRILKLNVEKILSVEEDQKKRELFLENLFQEALEAGNIMLLIENIDRVLATSKERVDISVPLEKYAKSSGLHIIGTTTPFLYQKFVFTNEKINHLFTKIDIQEIGEDVAITILMNLTPLFEKRNGVYISYEAIADAVTKSKYYITEIPFPEKAIKLLDSACVVAKKSHPKGPVIVTPETVDQVVSQQTHTPTQLDSTLKTKLLTIKDQLSSWIVHQPQAVEAIEKTLQSSFVMLGKRKKPLASFLFLGPTGVGKTETAKALSTLFFEDEKHLIRVDMSSYQRPEDVPQLIGSMDTQTPGLLPEKIRELPYGVLLLDEIEKAHKDLANLFLTLLDEGYFMDGYGKIVDCKHLIIIATSNAGSDKLFKKTMTQEELMNFLIENTFFSPEFLNRFDGIVLYQALDQEALFELGKKLLSDVAKNLYSLHKVTIEVSDQTLRDLIQNTYKPEFGARNLFRTINSQIESQVAKLILEGRAREGSTVKL